MRVIVVLLSLILCGNTALAAQSTQPNPTVQQPNRPYMGKRYQAGPLTQPGDNPFATGQTVPPAVSGISGRNNGRTSVPIR